MANEHLRLEGVKELDSVLQQLPTKIARQVMGAALRSGGTIIRNKAKEAAPVDDGDLQKSIIMRTVRDAANVVMIRIGPIRSKFWGLFQEFGTRFHAPQPFLRPAFEESKLDVLNRIGRQIGRGVERAAERLAGPYVKSGLRRRRRR